MKDHIYIIGAGAIGKALAVFLKSKGENVTLLRGGVDEPGHREVLRVLMADRDVEAEIEISSLVNFPLLSGIIVITTKSFANQKLAQVLRDKASNAPIILLQNGLGVEQAFIDNGFNEIYRCVLFVTSQVLEDGTVRFKPVSPCPIGTIAGDDLHLKSIVSQMTTDQFSFVEEPDIQRLVWKKAIANVVFNSVCPLLETDNGIFHRDPSAEMIAKKIVSECLYVANANGINLEMNEVMESLLRISKLSDGQLISTLQDIRRGRQTEIDTLNFAIVAMAKTLGMEHRVTETKILGELIKLKSKLNER